MDSRFLDRLASSRRRPMILAHRGDSAHAPENTLEAARLGREAGAEAWELDAQLTRDGVAVVLHDASLARTTDVAARFPDDPRGASGYRVVDFDWWEVRDLDAGSWFVAATACARSAAAFGTLPALAEDQVERYRSGRVRVPTLEQALALTAQLDWLVNVELKSFPDQPAGLLEAAIGAIERTGTWDRVLLSSFDHRDIARVPQVLASSFPGRPDLARGILAWTPLSRPWDYLADLVGGRTFHTSAEALGSESAAYRRRPCAATLRGEEVAALKARGIPTLVYTVNDHRPGGLAEHLAELGVAGLFTDDPAGLRSRFDGD